jgi:hypothetical protein
MQEEFRKIEGYDNYLISNLGHVKNNLGRIKRSRIDPNGYKILTLSQDNKKKTFKLHRLLAITFLENPENKPWVDHIDNNKLNNSLSNLRWASKAENNWNSKISKVNKSGVKGVSWCKHTKKWKVGIHKYAQNIHLGYFDNLEEAKQVRMKEANKLFGEFTNSCEKIIHINVNININVNQEQLELDELEKELERIMNL